MTGPMLRNAVLLAGVAMAVGVALGSSLGDAKAPRLAVTSAFAQPTPTTLVQGSGGLCYHTSVSDWWCPDSSARFFRPDQISQMELIITTRDGRRRPVNVPGGVDAVFLTREATEKFLLSYYWSLDRIKAINLTRALTAIP